MPNLVSDLFNENGIKSFSKARWNEKIDSQNEGIYIISLSSDPNQNIGISVSPNFSDLQIQQWINKVPNFLIDEKKPTLDLVKNRLLEFWLHDENILYIGKAPRRSNNKGVGNRVSEYYRTILGNGSPHSGGQWIKTLANLKDAYVYYGFTKNPTEIEFNMLTNFMSNVNETTKEKLRDTDLPLPFANIRYKTGVDKNHGMKNQRL
ncbi:MAG: hypothetical protein IH949_12880 [Bacteroidetes bacterium]|nr:hypothetical protein [Bacteroidota bacterium]